MWRGLYTAGSGMVSEMYRTDNIANNLSNANTTGYKRDEVVLEEFEPMLLHRINDKDDKFVDVTKIKEFSVNPQKPGPVIGELGRGSDVAEITTDYSQGSFMTTANPLDLAISGDGFFAVQTAQGVRYTRDGNFYRAANGNLVNVNGENVLDTRGRAITLPENGTDIAVGPDGRITAGTPGQMENMEIGQLQFVQFDNPREQLRKVGNNQLTVVNDQVRPVQATGSIQQGMLERANTNVVQEMVNLITAYRGYEANSKAVTTQDSLLEKAVNEVGRGQ